MLMLCALPLALSACSTVRDLPPGYMMGADATEGLAIVSLTLSGKDLRRISSLEYRVREVAEANTGEMNSNQRFGSVRQFARWVQDKDLHGPAGGDRTLVVKAPFTAEPLDVVESGSPRGRVAVLRLPAGDYELYDWKMVVPDEYGGNEFSPKRAVTMRFRVEAGRASYLGDVDLHVTDRDSYNITIEDKAQRDLALLAKKLPSIHTEGIVSRLLTAVRL
ncbi:hypothetical protein CDA09_20505 [Azoarcus sp. DN11]|nr:hypothetical protein CDA09_20505 [Azoarcus sp. DN11]